MKKTILILLSLLTLSGAATAQPSIQIESQTMKTNPAPVQAGEQADAVFRIENKGNTKAEDLTVRLIGGYPFQVKPDRKTVYDVGDLAPGQTRIISTDIIVAEDAPEGPQEFKINTQTTTANITSNTIIDVQTQDIELSLQGLQTQPPSLKPGIEQASLTAEIANNGEKTAESAVLKINLPEDFKETSSFSTRKALGNIQAGQVKSTQFVFETPEDTRSGLRNIPYEITYTEGDDTETITQSGSFQVYVEGVPQFTVQNVESNLQPGKKGTVTIKVKNTGSVESEATRVRALETGDQPFTYTSAADFVGNLEPNQTGTAKFRIKTDSSANKESYLLNFEFRGVQDTTVQVEQQPVKVNIQTSDGDSGSFNVVLVAAATVLLLVAITMYYFREQIRKKIQAD